LKVKVVVVDLLQYLLVVIGLYFSWVWALDLEILHLYLIPL
jgi:hypothetical protein